MVRLRCNESISYIITLRYTLATHLLRLYAQRSTLSLCSTLNAQISNLKLSY
jgi:hypothetical protein